MRRRTGREFRHRYGGRRGQYGAAHGRSSGTIEQRFGGGRTGFQQCTNRRRGAGKGFAVVASEVGNLATQTAKATEEIEMQISGIQSATEDSVHAIDGITKTIGEINEITTSIAAAVEEQGKATQEIARNVDQASNGTQEVTNSITSVASAVAATGQAAGKVQTSATGLTEQSENLAGAVQHFLAKVRTGTDAIDLVEADPDTVDTDAVNPAAVATDEIDSMAA